MLIKAQGIARSFGERYVFRNSSFQIEEGEHIAITGRNGAGKTTLIRLIAGIDKPDEGEVFFAKNKSISLLRQTELAREDETIYEHLLSSKKELFDMEAELRRMEKEMKHTEGDELHRLLGIYASLQQRFEESGAYGVKSFIDGTLKGLGFREEEKDRPMGELSGGERTRVALARLLLEEPDCLLLDEPTNHLDIESVQWLEATLRNYPKTLVLISHDRYFLDHTVKRILDIENAHIDSYDGNYGVFRKKKEEKRHREELEYEAQQKEIKRQEAIIDRLRSFNREKSIRRAESREKVLEKMDRLTLAQEEGSMVLRLVPETESAKHVLHIENLSKGFGERTLFRDLDLDLLKGERLAIIGANGTGKSTLLRILCGNETADTGSFSFGNRVKAEYFDQEHRTLSKDKTVFEEIHDAFPDLTEGRIRSVLALFLFRGDDVFKKISSLSGGEEGRVAIAKLMLSKANFLLLDEPTNHLDTESKEVLEEALRSYEGTVLYVSHDRWFVNQTATRILELYGERFTSYGGNYDYYMEKRDLLRPKEETEKAETVSASKEDWKEQKRRQAEERKLRQEIEKLKKECSEIEHRLTELQEEAMNPDIQSDAAALLKIHTEEEALEDRLMECLEALEEKNAL